jgi:hypothetical protein
LFHRPVALGCVRRRTPPPGGRGLSAGPPDLGIRSPKLLLPTALVLLEGTFPLHLFHAAGLPCGHGSVPGPFLHLSLQSAASATAPSRSLWRFAILPARRSTSLSNCSRCWILPNPPNLGLRRVYPFPAVWGRSRWTPPLPRPEGFGGGGVFRAPRRPGCGTLGDALASKWSKSSTLGSAPDPQGQDHLRTASAGRSTTPKGHVSLGGGKLEGVAVNPPHAGLRHPGPARRRRFPPPHQRPGPCRPSGGGVPRGTPSRRIAAVCPGGRRAPLPPATCATIPGGKRASTSA